MLHELISGRWSPRKFDNRPVEPEKLAAMFDAARRAASCFNEQPWRFVWAARDDSEAFGKLSDALVEKNREWAADAPVLFLTVAAKNFSHNGKENSHARHDVGLAMGNLSLQAASMGIMVHQMAGFDSESARRNLNIPDGYEPVAMVAAGYPVESTPAEEKRNRRGLGEVVFNGGWGRENGLPGATA